ncbi:MAG: TVP38/TMEM64 family protein [Magnetospiraceae bacterium]
MTTPEANTVADNNGAKRGFSWGRLLPLGAIALAIAAFFAFGLDAYLSFDALAEHRRDLLAWRDGKMLVAVLTFMGVYALAVALSLPGGIWLTIAGGFLFGVVASTIYVVIGATLGATAIFLAARYAIGDYLEKKASGAIQRMEAGFRDNAISYMLVLRLVPLFPFWLVNLVPAFLGVKLRHYVICTFFGIIPGTAVYAWVGSGVGALIDAGETPDVGIIFAPEILGPILGLAALAAVPIFYKKFKKSKEGQTDA